MYFEIYSNTSTRIQVYESRATGPQTAASLSNHKISPLVGFGLLLRKHRRNDVEIQKRHACHIHLMPVTTKG